MHPIDYKFSPEFQELERVGIVYDYVKVEFGLVSPAATAAQLIAQGFLPKGSKVRWLNANGYPYEQEEARKIFDQSKTYTVKRCRVGNSSSTYEFEEVPGNFNTVMFEKVSD